MSRTEYGLRVDCVRQGCDPFHDDNGRVVRITPESARTTVDPEVDGHAATVVRRRVRVSGWAPIEERADA